MYYSTPRSAYTDSSAQRNVNIQNIGYQTDSLVDIIVLNKLTLPKLEPEVYSGYLLNFPIWINVPRRHPTSSPTKYLFFSISQLAGKTEQIFF